MWGHPRDVQVLEIDSTINKHSDLTPTLKPKISKTSKQMNTLNLASVFRAALGKLTIPKNHMEILENCRV